MWSSCSWVNRRQRVLRSSGKWSGADTVTSSSDLLFDDDFKAKPAYHAVREALAAVASPQPRPHRHVRRSPPRHPSQRRHDSPANRSTPDGGFCGCEDSDQAPTRRLIKLSAPCRPTVYASPDRGTHATVSSRKSATVRARSSSASWAPSVSPFSKSSPPVAMVLVTCAMQMTSRPVARA
jgi:hypothetical protein